VRIMNQQPDLHPVDLPPGLSQPAIRALLGAGCWRLEDVAAFSEAELKKLHGMGPRGIEILRSALAERGLSFGRLANKSE
jgi:hypothetical protein